MPFRGELAGLSAMSQVLFGKSPEAVFDAREPALADFVAGAQCAGCASRAPGACGILAR
ncbi:hypothetical protein ACTMU2_38130 [Cupriavidus basilensis]